MNKEHFFGKAKWVGELNRTKDTFSVLRGKFNASSLNKITANVLGLGFFKCYINGKCVNPNTFLPLSSDYEASKDPRGEVLTGHRIYVPEFDITEFCVKGENTIAVYFGGGWYTHPSRVFGLPKAIYRISVTESDGVCEYFSNESCRIGKGFVKDYNLLQFETHDCNVGCDFLESDFDDSLWATATVTEQLDTEYCVTDCPIDALKEVITPKRLSKTENGAIYDCAKNTTGYPVIKINAPLGETVTVLFSEELSPDGTLDTEHSHGQKFTVISDGNVRTVHPEFTWFAFRYFEIMGNAEPTCVNVIYADIDVSSTFDCDNETLNWIYKTFINTMLCNMHIGQPSDCPHIERRGYTGDGQLTCNAVLSILDAEAFYKKWMQDIADGQDSKSGHIQYTAPYIVSGGGPGGWGIAIVEVPYQFYKHFGDKEILSKYYDNMRRYIDFLNAHSEFGLVTSDVEGAWVLGDWCGPNILYSDKDITYFDQQILVPATMVNTYFLVKALQKMCEIAEIIGKSSDIEEYKKEIECRKRAITAAYFNTFDGNFIMNAQGANAFAADLGLGSKKTYENLVNYYKKLGHFDTGIFATDILTRILFENGDAELAVALLTTDGEQGFEHWRRNGATTFHEYWDSNRSRSHNHPMFGAPVAYFFEYLLGIKQDSNTAGYSSVTIAPQAVSLFNRMSGSIDTKNGKIAVAYQKENGGIRFNVKIPKNVKATFKYLETDKALTCGENEIFVKAD